MTQTDGYEYTERINAYAFRFLDAYITCALWSSTDDDGEPLDAGFELDDIHPDSLDRMSDESRAFISANWGDLRSIDASQAGHDFWLTRNGHGAGFWDRGLGEAGERLTASCKRWGEQSLMVGDDGQLFVA